VRHFAVGSECSNSCRHSEYDASIKGFISAIFCASLQWRMPVLTRRRSKDAPRGMLARVKVPEWYNAR
jgi:hypothetical protein